MKKIAILGATSHIAKNLIYQFINNNDNKINLYLFVRNKSKLDTFLDLIDLKSEISINIENYKKFDVNTYDLVINCVGVGTPKGHEFLEENIIFINEKFDNLVLDYLRKNPLTKYIYFSSGAVYGKEYPKPIDNNTKLLLDINHLSESDFYLISKISSEAKHRALKDYFIVDLRLFNFFSRFIDLNGGYLITEIINSLKEKKVLKTNSQNIIRDYVHPEDLFQLIKKIINYKGVINDFIDIYSKAPIKKFELLEAFKDFYGLKYEIKDINFKNITGLKSCYFSKNKKAEKLLGYLPKYSSLKSLKAEYNQLNL